jgi:hypothetical protein
VLQIDGLGASRKIPCAPHRYATSGAQVVVVPEPSDHDQQARLTCGTANFLNGSQKILRRDSVLLFLQHGPKTFSPPPEYSPLGLSQLYS